MDLNKVIIAGRATRDAELRTTTSGATVAKFTLASNALKDHTNFVDIVCWNKKADFAERFVKKGKGFIVAGRINQDSYEDKNGVKRYIFEVICEDIYFMGGKKETLDDDFDVEQPVPLDTIPF